MDQPLRTEPVPSPDPATSPLRSTVTSTVPQLLSQWRASLVASTYQAGFVVALRAESPDVLNTHFRRFPRPMGLAGDGSGGRLALGTGREVVEFWNMAAVCNRLDPPGRHDACYLPRKSHITGDIDVHEMAWATKQPSGDSSTLDQSPRPHLTPDPCLWFVNTRFSCLCTLDADHSFVPRWWPSFVSALGPEDRCHLNGLALVDGQPRFVTALGQADVPAGWRERKADGGVLIDVASGEILTRGLSMPHSPRWYDGRLWLLESGDGSVGTVDLSTGRYEPVVKLSGFTRGMCFLGPFAFIGLSQVRESAVFSSIPLVDRLKDRTCGVAAVDLRSGRQVGYVQFQDAVQEIFAVEVLPHRFPDLLEPADDHVGNSYSLPDAALQHVARSPRE